MMLIRRLWVACTAGIVSAACAQATSPLAHQQCSNPDARLAAVLQPLEALRANGCTGVTGSECARLERDVERLAVICPGHVPTLLANAVLAYDDHRPAQSQQ